MTEETASRVGYMNPPEHTRFKRGTSGNPRGRPRKRKGMNTVLQRVLTRKVPVKDSGTRMPIREALIWKLRDLALQGDKQALTLQRQILIEAGYDKPDPDIHEDGLKAIEEAADKISELIRAKEAGYER